jgi:hypothetical protein
MAAIKMAAVNSSTLLLMNLWTAFMELPETWIACAHFQPPGRRGLWRTDVQKVLAGLPATVLNQDQAIVSRPANHTWLRPGVPARRSGFGVSAGVSR